MFYQQLLIIRVIGSSYRFIQKYRKSVMLFHNNKDSFSKHIASAKNSRIRPQTPQPNTSYNPTFKNFNPRNQTINEAPQYPNLSKSRLSMNSSSSGLAFLNQTDQNQMFPEDLVFLLKNQDRNINHFKQKIQKEKSKVQNDFVVLKNQLQHILQDLKISVQAELDLVYKTFITKYTQMKGEVQELRKMRKQILMQNAPHGGIINSANSNMNSNKDLIEQIERDAEQFRSYKIYGYLSELVKQKLSPILQLSTDLILIGSAECSFYRNKEMNESFKNIKSNFNGILSGIYSNLGQYVYTPQAIVDRQRNQQQMANMNMLNNTILRSMDGNMGQQPSFKPISPQRNLPHFNMNNSSNVQNFDINANTNTQSQKVYYQNQFALNANYQLQPQQPSQFPSHQQPLNYQQQENSKIATFQQSIATKWVDSVSLNKLATINTDHTQEILCIYFVDNKYLATGSRDNKINIYSVDSGQKISTLQGHQAAICCLSSVMDANQRIYLASGSDHKCCSLILWDTKNWNMVSKVQSHSAAVTSILDLEDGYHLLTGSYDKKINLFNFVKGQIVHSLDSNKTSVTRMLMSADKLRLITSGLDCGLSVWKINRKNKLVQSIEQMRVIMNDKILCCMNTSILRPDLVFGGTKDGKLKVFNITTGNIEKTFAVNQNSVIEMFVVERQMKNDCPITLTCSAKDRNLIMTKTETGVSSFLKMDNQINIEFGCGIGPKIVACRSSNPQRSGIVAIASQNASKKQFSLYQLALK